MDNRKIFYKIYWRLQGSIAPTLKYSQYLYEDIISNHVNPDIKWLDLGCGHQILPTWRSKEEKFLAETSKMIVGIDYDLHSLKKHKHIAFKVRGDISNLPFKDNFFDLVTANMVVEHLERPKLQFQEVKRILNHGGLFIFHTPNKIGYTTIMARVLPKMLINKFISFFQGRKEEDIFDTYYRSNTRKKIAELTQKIGFEVVKTKMIVSSAQFIIIPPLVLLELIWIRILMTKPFKAIRTNIIAILKKKI